MNRALRKIALWAGFFLCASDAMAQFTYRPAGELVSGSGRGRADTMVYAPGIRYPIETAPSYPNSQVWGVGGSQGPSGSQCDTRNFSYPWRDNYCESRTWDMPMCPAGQGHQGQDIRARDCMNNVHWVVSVADGTVTNIGSYSVYITSADGTRFDYLHMASVQVSTGQRVTRGQRVGRVSNQFGGTPTSVHLHFNIRKNVTGFGNVYAPPYMSLVRAYEALLGTPPTPTGPRFGAQFVMQSFPLASTTLNLAAGAEQSGFFEMRNTGTETWRPGEVFFGTTQPRDRTSPARGSDWVAANRPATVDRVVAPGATGRFVFSLRAPTTVGQEYSEFFGMVRESVAWFSAADQGGPADNLLQVRVRAATAAAPDAGVRDAALADVQPPRDVQPPPDVQDVVEVDEPAPAEDAGEDAAAEAEGPIVDEMLPDVVTEAGARDARDEGGPPVAGGCGCAVPAGAPVFSMRAAGLLLAVLALRSRRKR